jgi:transposase
MSSDAPSNATDRCPNCARLEARVATLEAQVAALIAELTTARAEIARLKKNSSTSSKPPSSDIVKPPRAERRRFKRKIGAQPGHPRHLRNPFSHDEVDLFTPYKLTRCPDCGDRLEPSDKAPKTIQQVEIREVPVKIHEHRGLAYWCPSCRRIHYGTIPPSVVAGGLFNEELTTLVAYMKGVCHASFSTIRKFLRDIVETPVSRGYLRKVLEKVTAALDGPYRELLASLPAERRLNVDETGHKDNGDSMWTWCFRASLFTVFKIDESRGSEVLVDVLGKEFGGVLGCDYFSAYRKYMKDSHALVQFCLAHLIRDVKFLTTLPDRVTANYGRRVLDCLKSIFKLVHGREQMDTARFQRQIEAARDTLVKTAKAAPLACPEAANLAKRFREHGDAYTRFITTPGIDPTNNLAEQAIRFVVLDRKVTQGTRSEGGQRWSERIWTTLATCAQQGRNVYCFIRDAVHAHFTNAPVPSLMPSAP